MPGKNKYASIKRPSVYRSLKRKGHSKTSAAKISNAGTSHAKRSRMAKKDWRTRQRRGKK